MIKSKIVFFLGIGIPAIFVFRALFLPGPVVWGDAPYFYPEALRGFVAGPTAWVSFGNNFGGINSFLFIYPLMFLYGSLNLLFGLSNDILIRLLFYFPAVLLALGAPVFLARYLGYSRTVQTFASLTYGLNTYFLLLVDGGQVGVALAYGLFPLAVLVLLRLIQKASLARFFLALVTLFALTSFDPRFLPIAVLTVFVWNLVDYWTTRKSDCIVNLKLLVPLLGFVVALSSYWVFPILKTGEGVLRGQISNLEFLSLLNSLVLFQPHWPLNEFGKTFPPPFYFVGVLFLIFGGLIFSRPKKIAIGWTFCFLFFAFLAKGGSAPFGEWYDWFVNITPFGFAFRDSTKFFAPLILFAGLLIGMTTEYLAEFLGNRLTPLRNSVRLLIYAYLLFLIYPAFFGKLNGVLSARSFPSDFEVIHQKLAEEEGFFRTLWFPERSPFVFHTEEKPALDAKGLVNKRPFATLNTGIFDRFNFLHNQFSLDWLDILGIKYLIFSGDFRKALNQEEHEEWNKLLSLVGRLPGLVRVNWNTEIPIYELTSPKPRVFVVDKLVVVLGSDNVYQKIGDYNPNFSLGNQAFLFLEDGRFDPSNLLTTDPKSFILILNNRTEADLTMNFLQEFFLSPKDAVFSQWAFRDINDYLRWKYEFLVNKLDIQEFDYQKGISFSTQNNEEIRFRIIIPSNGEYLVALRSLTRDTKDPLLLDGEPILYKSASNFEWFIKTVQLTKGEQVIVIRNKTGFHAINTLALIPKDRWEKARNFTAGVLRVAKTINLDGIGDKTEIDNFIMKSKWHPISYKQMNPVFYNIILPETGNWLVFSDSYHPRWQLKNTRGITSSLPFYSAINGFYFNGSGEAQLVFDGQKEVELGIYLSLASIFILTGTYFLISRLND